MNLILIDQVGCVEAKTHLQAPLSIDALITEQCQVPCVTIHLYQSSRGVATVQTITESQSLNIIIKHKTWVYFSRVLHAIDLLQRLL